MCHRWLRSLVGRTPAPKVVAVQEFVDSMSPGRRAGGNVAGVNDLSLEAAYAAWASELVRHASALVSPSLAADVVADTFASLVASDGSGWAGARSPRAYLFGAVANTARMHHRAEARLGERTANHLALVGHESAARVADEHVGGDLVDVLMVLSPSQREIVSLTYWEDLDPAGIAEILGVSQGTVRKQLARARARMREVLS